MKKWISCLRNKRRFGEFGGAEYLDPSAKIARSAELESPVCIGKASSVKQARIGRYSYLSYEVRVHDATVGRYCSIAPQVVIGGLGRHPTDHFSTSPITFSPDHGISRRMGHSGTKLDFVETGTTHIGHDVWIGTRAIIADGVSVGHGAIIGANTVVTKDVPPYAVYYGSPPSCHRFRFAPETIEKLLASEWWNATPEEIDDPALLSLIERPAHNDSPIS